MTNAFDYKIAQVEQRWDALALESMDKADLTADQLALIAKRQMSQKEELLLKGRAMLLARFKATAIEQLECDNRQPAKARNFQAREPEEVARHLASIIANDMVCLADFITGHPQKKREAEFHMGLFVQNDDNSRTPYLHVDSRPILTARIGNLPCGVLDNDHPEFEKKEVKELIQIAQLAQLGGFKEPILVPSFPQAMEKLWDMGIIKSAPLNSVLLMDPSVLHCSTPLPPAPVFSAFLRRTMPRPGEGKAKPT